MKPVYNICRLHNIGTFNVATSYINLVATCPNKCIYHDDCIFSWSLYESYCIKCDEELTDIE